MGEEWCKNGNEVEVSIDKDGFRGSWYTAKILRSSSRRMKKIFLEYHNLMADDTKKSKPLREYADVTLVRPRPPLELNHTFKLSEEVDAFYNDGWWEGFITAVLGDSMYSVFFRSSGGEVDCHRRDLRLHREWVHGNWIPPLEEEREVTEQSHP